MPYVYSSGNDDLENLEIIHMETHKNAKVNYGMFVQQFNELNEH